MEQGPRRRWEGTEEQEPNRKSQPNLELSASFLMRLSSLHWSSREVTTEMGPEVRKWGVISVAAEKRVTNNSSRYGECVLVRPSRTGRGETKPF